MKSFFKRILAKKEENESRKLAPWMSDLAEMDDISAIRLSAQYVKPLADDENLSTDQKLDIILELEEINQPRLDKLSHQFANLANLKADLETNITEACYNYSRQSYIYHLKLVELVISPVKAALTEEKLLLLLVRTLNTAFNMLKWRAFLQQNQPTKIWLQTFLLYKIAHTKNLLNTPVEQFPLSPATTLAASIVQLCMFGQLKNASLDRQHIHATDKILHTWLTHAHISAEHTPEQYLFYVDLTKDSEAKRMRHFEPTENCRYWELNDLEKRITTAITVSARGEMPESLILSKLDNAAVINETLSILHAEWSKEDYVRQRRSEEREATSELAKVKAGISRICDQVLSANQLNSGLQLSKQANSLKDLIARQSTFNQSNELGIDSASLDTWIITDRSVRGLGARVNKYANTLARTKKLIGLTFDDDPTSVSIGIIRAVKPTQGTQLRVGIEVLSNLAIWTQMKLSRDNDVFAAEIDLANKKADEMQSNTNISPGIYLPKESGISEQATIIMPKMNFRPDTEYTMLFNGKTKRVKFDQPIQSHDDWVQVAVDL